jgi:hypothetical protein
MEKAASRLRQLSTDLEVIAPAAAAELNSLAGGLQKAAEGLSQEVPPPDDPSSRAAAGAARNRVQIVRYGTVCGRFRGGNVARVSDMRFGGLWLKGAGFQIGQKYEIRVEGRGKLTIRAIEKHPRGARQRVVGA